MPVNPQQQPRTMSYPLRLDSRGKAAEARTQDEQDQSRLRLALGTQQGERVMHPALGTNLVKAFYITGGGPDNAAGTMGQNKVTQTLTQAISTVFTTQFQHLVLKGMEFNYSADGSVLTVDVMWDRANAGSHSKQYTRSGSVDMTKQALLVEQIGLPSLPGTPGGTAPGGF